MANKTSQYFFYIGLFFSTMFLIVPNSLLAEGFVAGTLVATPMGHIPIEYLQEDDLVISYNFTTATIELTPITNIFKKKATEITQLAVCNDVIQVDYKHKFYCPLLKEQWTHACNLQKHDFLIKGLREIVRIDAIASVTEERDVYYLSLQDNHNFFVSQHEILVHNFAIPLVGAAIAWFLENFVVTIGVTIFGVGAVIYNNEKSKSEFPQQNGTQEESIEGNKDKNEESNKDPEKGQKEEEKSKERKECKWKDTTKGRSTPNIETDVTQEEFEKTLINDGWTVSPTKDGKAMNYEKDGSRYAVRNNSKSTQGPTAEFFKRGSKDADCKIRLIK